jgi:hypothetical protein
MDWTFGLLTTKQAEKALSAAGLPIDPCQWDTAQMEKASEVLDAAVAEKRARLLAN